MTLTERGIRFGIWWASSPQRALATVGVVWLNTLKGPLGDWSRAMTLGIVRGAVRGGITGLAFTARTTWTRLLIPVGVWARPAVVRVGTRIGVGAAIIAPPVAVAAGFVITAAVVSGVVVAAQQEVGLVGPEAPKMGMGGWFGEKYQDLQINPFMISMGTVV